MNCREAQLWIKQGRAETDTMAEAAAVVAHCVQCAACEAELVKADDRQRQEIVANGGQKALDEFDRSVAAAEDRFLADPECLKVVMPQ